MNSNFNLLNKCYKFIEYYDNILINFPNKTIVLKKSIETSTSSIDDRKISLFLSLRIASEINTLKIF